ncbi:MAG: amidohydrolase [Comamonadaceae bacterium]|nr:MAG: amidohydrolase [Comamonadaceae bacterium]
MRIDAHQHYWSPHHGDYGWLVPSRALRSICRPFAPPDLHPHLNAAEIAGTVLVQAAPSAAETLRLLEIAARPGSRVLGVVGWCDFEAPDAPAQVCALAGNPLLKGLRPMLQDLPDPRWILRPEVAPALDAMERMRLALDLLVKPHQLDAVQELAQRRPALHMVIDHAAKPSIPDGFQRWAEQIGRVAQHKHLHCKLSGLLTEAPIGAGVETLRPFSDHLLQAFGPERLLWGSDWPVLTLAASYAHWYGMSGALLSGLSAAQQALVFGGNAARFYRMDAST